MKLKKANVLKWIFDNAKGGKAGIVLLALVQAAVSGTAVVFAILLQKVVDMAVGHNRAGLINWLLLLTGLILAQILFKGVAKYGEERVKATAENAIRRNVYNTILNRSYGDISRCHSGELLTRLTSDTSTVVNSLVMVFPHAFAMLVKLMGAAIVLFALDWRFTLIYLVGGLVILGVTALFRNKLKSMHKKVQKAEGKVRSFIQETLGSLLVIRSFGYEQGALNVADDLMDNHKARRLEKNMVAVLCSVGFGLLMNGGYMFGLAWCAFGIVKGQVTYGTLTAVLQLVGQMQTPFANFSLYISRYYEMVASAERLMDLENMLAEPETTHISKEERDQLYENLSAIEIRDITFAYSDRDSENVLENASYSINKRDFVAIMGNSGIGKSTLLKLLLAVYEPAEGTMEFVDNFGRKQTVSASTRPMFSYVPQESFMLSGTIGAAVAPLGQTEIDRDAVLAACKIACADFVTELPEGIDTKIGERGMGLSEGQKQRLAIARAIYADAPILLLDEATSALDMDTEQRVLQNIRELTDKTVIIVTHRTGALDYCNRIVTVENKKLI